MILNKKEVGKLALLKYLLEQDDFVYKDSVLEHFNISSSTLKRYASSTNEDLKTIKEFQHIQILDKDASYYLDNASPFNGQYVMKKLNLSYHMNSLQFQLFQKVFSCSIKSLTSLKTSLSISLPYLYKLLFNANLFLKPFLIKIDYSMNLDTLDISGHGTNIRLFETYFFWTVNQGIEWPFENITPDEIYASFSENELKTIFSVSHSKQLKYLYSVAVIHKLYPSDEHEIYLDDGFKETLTVFQSVYDQSQPLKRLLSSHEEKKSSQIIETECLFFNFISRVFCSCRDSEEIQNKIGNKLVDLDNDLIAYCKKLVNALFVAFPELSTLKGYANIQYQLLYFFSLYFANIFYIQFDSSFLQEFMVMNPNIEPIHSGALNRSKDFFNSFINDNPLPANKYISDFHLTLAYGLIYSFTSKTKSNQLAIYIHFSENMFSAFYVEAELYKLFGRENILIVERIDKADIIISDFYEQRYKQDNYFYFDDTKNITQWKKMYSFVHDHQLNNLN